MGNTQTLHSACSNGDIDSIKELINNVNNINIELKDSLSRTPLLLASSLPIMYSNKINKNKENSINDTSLDKNSTKENKDINQINDINEANNKDNDMISIKILNLLIQKQANINYKDDYGWNALHYACNAQNIYTIKYLVEKGVMPIRDNYGLLPQDYLVRLNGYFTYDYAQECKDLLEPHTNKSEYKIKLLGLRSTGIIQLDLGDALQANSLVTVEYSVPDNHSLKDYIQILIFPWDKGDPKNPIFGSYQHVPEGGNGQLIFKTDDIPIPSLCRFVYIKTDINALNREIVASGCNTLVQLTVKETFEYELYLHDRIIEIETMPEYDLDGEPSIMLKRIGIAAKNKNEEVDWVELKTGNQIIAVDNEIIAGKDFDTALSLLQGGRNQDCTKLLIQNTSVTGDFIAEKILGPNVIDKYATLKPITNKNFIKKEFPVNQPVNSLLDQKNNLKQEKQEEDNAEETSIDEKNNINITDIIKKSNEIAHNRNSLPSKNGSWDENEFFDARDSSTILPHSFIHYHPQETSFQ